MNCHDLLPILTLGPGHHRIWHLTLPFLNMPCGQKWGGRENIRHKKRIAKSLKPRWPQAGWQPFRCRNRRVFHCAGRDFWGLPQNRRKLTATTAASRRSRAISRPQRPRDTKKGEHTNQRGLLFCHSTSCALWIARHAPIRGSPRPCTSETTDRPK